MPIIGLASGNSREEIKRAHSLTHEPTCGRARTLKTERRQNFGTEAMKAMIDTSEKYVVLVRRKICTFGLAKNMHFGPDEKYVVLGRPKVCGFGPTKNMHFGADKKYALLVWRKICDLERISARGTN